MMILGEKTLEDQLCVDVMDDLRKEVMARSGDGARLGKTHGYTVTKVAQKGVRPRDKTKDNPALSASEKTGVRQAV